jgi:hypothetical protein
LNEAGLLFLDETFPPLALDFDAAARQLPAPWVGAIQCCAALGSEAGASSAPTGAASKNAVCAPRANIAAVIAMPGVCVFLEGSGGHAAKSKLVGVKYVKSFCDGGQSRRPNRLPNVRPVQSEWSNQHLPIQGFLIQRAGKIGSYYLSYAKMRSCAC